MATLFAARDSAEHPLRRAAALHPTLAFDIDTIASAGGSAAHHGSAAAVPGAVFALTTTVYKTVSSLTGLVLTSGDAD
jgi:hypothetical protein